MDKNSRGLLALKQISKGYVLLTSMVVLGCICFALAFQYRYYARQYQLEEQITAKLINKTKENLQEKKQQNRKRYLEFANDNR